MPAVIKTTIPLSTGTQGGGQQLGDPPPPGGAGGGANRLL